MTDDRNLFLHYNTKSRDKYVPSETMKKRKSPRVYTRKEWQDELHLALSETQTYWDKARAGEWVLLLYSRPDSFLWQRHVNALKWRIGFHITNPTPGLMVKKYECRLKEKLNIKQLHFPAFYDDESYVYVQFKNGGRFQMDDRSSVFRCHGGLNVLMQAAPHDKDAIINDKYDPKQLFLDPNIDPCDYMKPWEFWTD